MGNLMSIEKESSEVKKYSVSDATLIEDKVLVDKILNKSKELYAENNKTFMDPEFCNNIYISYSYWNKQEENIYIYI